MTPEQYFAYFSLVASLVLMHFSFGFFSVKKLNVVQFLYGFHVLVQFIPALIIYNDGSYFAAGKYLFSVSVALWLIPIGAFLADIISAGSQRDLYYARPLTAFAAVDKHYNRFFGFFLAFGVLALATYVAQVPSFPLYNLLTGASDAVTHQLERRDAAANGFVYGLSQRFVMPMIFAMAVLNLRWMKGQAYRWINWIVIGIAFLHNSWPGNKTPVATLFAVAAIALILVRQTNSAGPVSGGKENNRGVFIFILGAVLYPALIFMFRPAGALGASYVFQNIFTRIFYKPALNTYMAFELYSFRPYTEFADIDRLADFVGWPVISLSQEIATYRGLGELTNSPPASIGTFFAQDGMLAVVLGVGLAALTFRLAENIVIKSVYKTSLTVTFHALLLFGAFRFSWANFHNLLSIELFAPMAAAGIVWTLLQPRDVPRPVAMRGYPR